MLDERNVPVLASGLDAIRSLAVMVDLQDAYRQAFREMVSAAPRETLRSDGLKYLKTIESQWTLSILLILWKESGFVADADLAALGMCKTFPDGINCNQLAIAVARSPAEVGRTIKRIDMIVEAGEAFGLVQREQPKASRIWWLSGTEKLNLFMLRFAHLLAEIGVTGIGGEPWPGE